MTDAPSTTAPRGTGRPTKTSTEARLREETGLPFRGCCATGRRFRYEVVVHSRSLTTVLVDYTLHRVDSLGEAIKLIRNREGLPARISVTLGV